jgi:hypothetical protein
MNPILITLSILTVLAITSDLYAKLSPALRRVEILERRNVLRSRYLAEGANRYLEENPTLEIS